MHAANRRGSLPEIIDFACGLGHIPSWKASAATR